MGKISRNINCKFSCLINYYRYLSRRSRWLFFAIIIAVFYLAYLSISFWLISPAEIHLIKLRQSWQNNKICHEACRLERQNSKEIIVNELKKRNNQNNLRKMIEADFFDSKITVEFKIELINILQLSFGSSNPPVFLREYMTKSDGDPILQAAILNSFLATALDLKEANSPLMYYFNILLSNQAEILKQTAIEIISNYPDKTAVFNLEQLNIMKKLIFSNQTERHLRQAIVLLIDDYYILFPKESAAILKTIYKTEINGDEVSRAFAADIFNRHVKPEEYLAAPIVSDTAWDEYYNY